jgi:protein TonB
MRRVAVADTMFRDVIEPSVKLGSKKGRTVWVSIVVHAAIVAALLIVPLIAPAVLPMPAASILAFAFPASPAALPPALQLIQRNSVPQTTNRAVDIDAAPVVAPSTITPERGVASTTDAIRTIENGSGGVPGGVGDPVALPPAPPVVRMPDPVPTAPKRVGGDIKPPTKMKHVPPVYPAVAQAARVEGTVIIQATISPAGKVADALVLRSNPLLDAAALEAVRQWEFTPTLLNGSAVAVIMTVTVDFRLR